MFAGSCIGVIFLVMSLTFLRRFHREFEIQIARSARTRITNATPRVSTQEDVGSESVTLRKNRISDPTSPPAMPAAHRPTIIQQSIRALLHMIQFAVAYFIMLLVMYYNGYIIISVLIGSFLGYFAFEWEPIGQ